MTDEVKISTKHIAVIEAYLANGYKRDKAVVAAGFKESRARQTASDIFKRPEVKAYLAKRMKELQMSADEAMLRISGHASGDMREFIGLTMEELKRHPNAWLIKELKYDIVVPKYWRPKAAKDKKSETASSPSANASESTPPAVAKTTEPPDDSRWEDLPPTFVYVDSIKLYDAQAALITVLKQHQLANGQPTDILDVPQLAELNELLAAAGKDFASVISRMVEKLKAEAEEAVTDIDIDELIDFGLGEEPLNAIRTLPDIVDWAEENFYIIQTARPIVLEPHQKDILRLITERRPDGGFRWRNVLYSTIKKSGKTAVSALYARWSAETWGPFQEVYNLGNKLGQAKDRAFKASSHSIQLAPKSIQQNWDLQETKLTHLPSGSFIKALPISGAGEAGGNQSLTVWTELWGFQYEDALLMWDELKPVLTRPLSQRFIDTYAGFKDESKLLWGIWQNGLAGERLHDELPIYGNEAAGLIAYIDTGLEARRMPWQKGEVGEQYYTEQERTERPENVQRHHYNLWADNTSALFSVALWDQLQLEPTDPQPGIEVILSADASLSNDCTALVAVGYNREKDITYEVETQIWTPPKDGRLDYEVTIAPEFEKMFGRYRVRGVVYDHYQLHDMMTRAAKKHPKTDFYDFPQGGERVQADTALLTRMQQGKIRHSGNHELRNHVQNAVAVAQGDDAIRIRKREKTGTPVDAIVALSMGSWRWHEVKPQSKPAGRVKHSLWPKGRR